METDDEKTIWIEKNKIAKLGTPKPVLDIVKKIWIKMTKVYCKKYQEELPALDKPPYPGPRGEEIFNNVSKKAWMEWLQLQTMLINEKQLNLAEKETRDYLNDQLDKFLNNGDVDRPVGFKPVE